LTNDTVGNNFFRIHWKFIGSLVNIAIVCNNINGFCAIGWSPPIGGPMIGSDAVVGSAFTTVNIDDYILNQQVPPANGTCPNAVCPETLAVFGKNCSNNVNNTVGSIVNGFTILEFTRPINASDVCDRNVEDGGIVWSMGLGAVPLGIQQHYFRNYGPFVWIRNYTATTAPSSIMTSAPSSIMTTVPSSLMTSAFTQTNSTMDTVQGASSAKGPFGLALWLDIVILVLIILAIIAIVTVVVVIIVRYKKRDRDIGFY